MATINVRIRTADTDWCARRAASVAAGNDSGHLIATFAVDVDRIERVTFAGKPMIRFDLGADAPKGHNRWAMYPASYADES